MERNQAANIRPSSCVNIGSSCNEEEGVGDAASCTLDPSAMPERVARWRRLFEQVDEHRLNSSEAIFKFSRTEEVTAELDELTKLERICCAHVSWSIKATSTHMILTLGAEPNALRLITNGFMPAANFESGIEEKR